MLTLPAFALARPTTIADAVSLLTEERVPYCGGTELLLAMRSGLLRPEALIDLKRVPELRGIGRRADVLELGATTTHADVATHPDVLSAVPVLARVAGKVGNARVRASGTIGGNLCFAEPRSDLATLLIALEASVRLIGPGGERELLLADFIDGAYSTRRHPDELLARVTVPVLSARRAVYLKYQTAERPTVGVALAERASGGVRLVVGAVGEAPVSSDHPSVEHIDARQIATGLAPIPDLTGSERYKRHVAAVYIERAVQALTGNGQEGSGA